MRSWTFSLEFKCCCRSCSRQVVFSRCCLMLIPLFTIGMVLTFPSFFPLHCFLCCIQCFVFRSCASLKAPPPIVKNNHSWFSFSSLLLFPLCFNLGLLFVFFVFVLDIFVPVCHRLPSMSMWRQKFIVQSVVLFASLTLEISHLTFLLTFDAYWLLILFVSLCDVHFCHLCCQ